MYGEEVQHVQKWGSVRIYQSPKGELFQIRGAHLAQQQQPSGMLQYLHQHMESTQQYCLGPLTGSSHGVSVGLLVMGRRGASPTVLVLSREVFPRDTVVWTPSSLCNKLVPAHECIKLSSGRHPLQLSELLTVTEEELADFRCRVKRLKRGNSHSMWYTLDTRPSQFMRTEERCNRSCSCSLPSGRKKSGCVGSM